MRNKKGLGSFNKKGQHELKRKAVRKHKRLHKDRTEGRIGPDNRDLAHHHAWTKPETKKQEQARLAKGQTNASTNEAPPVEASGEVR